MEGAGVADERQSRRPIRTKRGALGRAAFLVFIDALVVNQGVVSAVVGLWILFVSVPVVALSRRYTGKRSHGFANVGIYLAAVAVVFAFNGLMNSMARERGEKLVSAIAAYHRVTGRYPDELEALVPTYIENVPLAKYTLSFNEFYYMKSGETASLMYISFPPFGRPYYSFQANEWRYMD